MGAPESEAARHLSAFLSATEAAASAFPELPGISELAILLAAMARADSGGQLDVGVWSSQTGIEVSTLGRFAKYFSSIGLMKADQSSGGTVWLEKSAFARLAAANGSASKQ